jgi:hypothetical protein
MVPRKNDGLIMKGEANPLSDFGGKGERNYGGKSNHATMSLQFARQGYCDKMSTMLMIATM